MGGVGEDDYARKVPPTWDIILCLLLCACCCWLLFAAGSTDREGLRAAAGHCSLHPHEARPRLCSCGGSLNIVLSILLQACGWGVTMLQVNLDFRFATLPHRFLLSCYGRGVSFGASFFVLLPASPVLFPQCLWSRKVWPGLHFQLLKFCKWSQSV